MKFRPRGAAPDTENLLHRLIFSRVAAGASRVRVNGSGAISIASTRKISGVPSVSNFAQACRQRIGAGRGFGQNEPMPASRPDGAATPPIFTAERVEKIWLRGSMRRQFSLRESCGCVPLPVRPRPTRGAILEYLTARSAPSAALIRFPIGSSSGRCVRVGSRDLDERVSVIPPIVRNTLTK